MQLQLSHCMKSAISEGLFLCDAHRELLGFFFLVQVMALSLGIRRLLSGTSRVSYGIRQESTSSTPLTTPKLFISGAVFYFPF